MTLEDLLSRLAAVRPLGGGWIARCPAHRDRSPSLSVRAGDDGRILLHCFAGCTVGEIATALQVRVTDLFERDPAPPMAGDARTPRRVIERERAVDTYRRRVTRRLANPRADHELADELRETERAIGEARRVAKDDEAGWELLALAAEAERDVMLRDRWT